MLTAAIRMSDGSKKILAINEETFTRQEIIEAIKSDFPEVKTILFSEPTQAIPAESLAA